ncbi:hypothetical protein BHE74_00006501, partial [Ensete ventricosum]
KAASECERCRGAYFPVPFLPPRSMLSSTRGIPSSTAPSTASSGSELYPLHSLFSSLPLPVDYLLLLIASSFAQVAASKVAVEETYHCMDKGSISKGKLEAALKKMCKEGVYWGKLNKNATLGGAISGLLISAASNNGRDKVIKDAITAGAVATAAEFINYFT